MIRLQFSIRALFLLMTCVALFIAGYLAGYDHGRNARLEELIELIRDTVRPNSELR